MIRRWRTARRAAALAVAAGLAGGCSLPTATAAEAPASATQQSTAGFVGLVVDDPAASLLLQRCVSWHPGLSGADVLAEAGVSVTYAPSGLIIALDDLPPKPKPVPPLSDYWSYWNNAGSRWIYSAQGAATSTPAAGSVEGWALGAGIAPPATPFASVCPDAGGASTPSPAPSSAHAPSTAASTPGQRASSTAAPRSTPQTSTARGTLGAAAGASSAGPALVASAAATASAGPTTSASRSPVSRPSGRGESSAGSRPSLVPVAQLSTRKSSSSGVLGAVLGVAAAAALGGLAFWRSRRRPVP
jgi:hypothetical protein